MVVVMEPVIELVMELVMLRQCDDRGDSGGDGAELGWCPDPSQTGPSSRLEMQTAANITCLHPRAGLLKSLCNKLTIELFLEKTCC